MTPDANENSIPPYETEQREESRQPDLSWPEIELRKYLAAAWDQKTPSTIKVIGRLHRLEEARHGFLEDLHHPATGVRLPAPAANSMAHKSVYVPAGELRKFNQSSTASQYAIAYVELSPIQERQKRNDPLACSVRPGSLTPLVTVPTGWGVHDVDFESAQLITEMARKVIEERLIEETSDVQEALEAAQEMLKEASSEQSVLVESLEKTRHELKEGADRIKIIEADAATRRAVLESKFRELESLLKEKGDRMLALKLIESEDLEKLFPSAQKEHERQGHDFETTLDGDWGRLAGYVQAFLWKKGMHYSQAQLLDFMTLLRTNDLIVLAGDSGSGKTSLIKSVAEAIGGVSTIVPVKPNWTSSEDLLGYYNPIEGRYHPSPFLLALLDASRKPDVPHFICLDEMNLARVEYYFADFLSLLEARGAEPWIHLYSSAEERQTAVDNRLFLSLEEEARKRTGLGADTTLEEILLHDGASNELRKLAGFQEADTVLAYHAKLRRSLAGLIEIPPGFRFPKNVWIVGSINVDETTHYLSPKILDRAHVIRFRNPVLADWSVLENEVQEFDLDLSLPVNLLAKDIGAREQYPTFDPKDPDAAWLVAFSRDYLDPLGIEFGLRAIRQSINYMTKAGEAGIEPLSALNNIVLHKILPKMVIELDKAAATGQKRRDILAQMSGALAGKLGDLNGGLVTESAVDAVEHMIARAEGNHGIANFWAR